MIELRGITKIYGENKTNTVALKSVNLRIKQGEMVAIIGKSGSGKSTMMNILGLLNNPNEGKYLLYGKEVQNISENKKAVIRNQSIGYIVQSFALIPEFTAMENIELPLKYTKRKAKDYRKLTYQLAEELGIETILHKMVSELSGGQKQRVAIARALINNPDVILADEPTGALDSKNRDIVLNILSELHMKKKTIIIITHDLDVANICERQVELMDGRIVKDQGNNI